MCTSVRSEEVLKAPRHQPLLNLFEVCEPWTAARIWCQSRSPAGWDHRHKPAADITLCQRRGEGGREGGRQSKHPDRVLLPQIPALRSGCVGTNYNNFLGCYCVYVKFFQSWFSVLRETCQPEVLFHSLAHTTVWTALTDRINQSIRPETIS